MLRLVKRPALVVIVTISLGVLLSAVAPAAARKQGDTLVYELVAGTTVTGSNHTNPFAAPGQINFKIAVTSMKPDQSAIVHVTVDNLPPPSLAHGRFGAASLKEFEEQHRYMQFDALLSPDGALLVAVDNNLQDSNPLEGLSQADMPKAIVGQLHSPEYQAKIAVNQAAGAFGVPNAVALSCAKRTSLSVGDTWHVVSKSDGGTYDVSVTGKQSYHGHDVVVLGAKFHMESPNGSISVDSTVYYDLQAHLIVGVHTVTNNEISVTGMKSTSTSDLNLKE
jgi:hypothetical protein